MQIKTGSKSTSKGKVTKAVLIQPSKKATTTKTASKLSGGSGQGAGYKKSKYQK